MTVSVLTQLVASTQAQIYAAGLQLATIAGLDVTSWREGDPSLALFDFVAEQLALRETLAAGFVASAFLSTASGDWLTLLAREVYGVERTEGTYATSTVTLLNDGGGVYVRAAGDITVRSSTSDVTYHSTSAVTLLGGASATVDVVADVVGSDGSADVNAIDELVTTMLGVSVTASTLALGVNEQADAALREQCESTLGALSPAGAPDAYEYVARNPALTGTTAVTRALVYAPGSTGTGTLYLAGADGDVAAGDVAAVQAAIEIWAQPIGFDMTAASATESPVNMTVTITGSDLPSSITADTQAIVGAAIHALEIDAALSNSAIITAVHSMLVGVGAYGVEVALSSISSSGTTPGRVYTPGTITVTVV